MSDEGVIIDKKTRRVARYLGAGLIVLMPAPGNRFVPPPPQFQISGADAQRRAIETAPTCPPSSLNVPCLNVVPGR